MSTGTIDQGRPRFLVAHSVIGMRNLLRRDLSAGNYTYVDEVADMPGVWKRLMKEPRIECLVISEGLDGSITCHDFITRIKAGPLNDIPILLLLSSHPSTEVVGAWGKLGVTGVMYELCTRRDFLRIVLEVLSKAT